MYHAQDELAKDVQNAVIEEYGAGSKDDRPLQFGQANQGSKRDKLVLKKYEKELNAKEKDLEKEA